MIATRRAACATGLPFLRRGASFNMENRRRCWVLKSLFHTQLTLGFAQAAIAAVLALAVVLLARRRNIHLESDVAIALLRGIVQIVAVGSILALLLKAPRWTSVFVLVGMVLAAGSISAKRAKSIPGAFKVSTYSIAAGAGLVTAIMTWAGVIDTAITSLIPRSEEHTSELQ